MITKRSLFTDRNVVFADRISFCKAISLEQELMQLAVDFSAYPDRTTPWDQVAEVFNKVPNTEYKPSQLDLKFFVMACVAAHRLESSLMVTRVIHARLGVKNPLTLRIKFYFKKDRQEFFEWYMIFGEMGRIRRAGFFGYGQLGKKVMHQSPKTLSSN